MTEIIQYNIPYRNHCLPQGASMIKLILKIDVVVVVDI